MEIQLSNINTYEFSDFIKKLLSIDKFIFMKIGKSDTMSSVYFPERDAVKLVNVPTSNLFESEIDSTIKVSFYNGSKVLDALSHFNGSAKGIIKYSKIGEELMASDFIIYDDDIRISLACADPSLSFMEMTKDEISRAFSPSDKLFEFDLLTTHADKIKSLFGLEKEEDIFTLCINEKGIAVKGKTYDATLSYQSQPNVEIGTEAMIYKKYLNLLDKENYKTIVCSNKIIFKSLDTNTLLTVAVAISDED